MASLSTSLAEFASSIAGIALSLFNDVLAVFHSLLNLGQNIIQSIVALARSLIWLALSLFKDAFGFVTGELDAGPEFRLGNKQSQPTLWSLSSLVEDTICTQHDERDNGWRVDADGGGSHRSQTETNNAYKIASPNSRLGWNVSYSCSFSSSSHHQHQCGSKSSPFPR